MIRLLVAATLLAAAGSMDAAVLSGPVINPANGNSYYLLEAASWTASQAEAVTLGGNLVTINDAAENQWILDIFNPFGGQSYLIGLSDSVTEGTFVWASGEPVTFTNWGAGEPNDAAGEDFSMMRRNGLWNDISNLPTNQGTLRGVVEVAVPEPSSLALLAFSSLAAFRRR